MANNGRTWNTDVKVVSSNRIYNLASLPSFLENGLICHPLWLVNIRVCWRHFFIQPLPIFV